MRKLIVNTFMSLDGLPGGDRDREALLRRRRRPGRARLVGSRASKTGVTINTYEPAGDVEPGSFEFEEPTEAERERRARLADG